MKIGIVTLFGYFNYGNRLQNYAIEQILQKQGFQAETLHFFIGGRKAYLKEIAKTHVCKVCKHIPFRARTRANRFCKFCEFNQVRLHVKEIFTLSHSGDDYDFLLTGSDQVWNPTEASAFTFLEFVEPYKRYSFSASFGVNEIPERQREMYHAALSQMAGISVREREGQKLVEELSGRKAALLLDPVMMLAAEEWEKVEIKPKHFKIKLYFVCYFLGQISTTTENAIQVYQQKTGFQRIDLYNKNAKSFDCGPGEFLFYIKHSQIVFTDSFHATAFSIIFRRNFWAFGRKGQEEDMSSRLRTLLDRFNFNSRFVPFAPDNVEQPVDYSNTDSVLAAERMLGEQYISSIFEKITKKSENINPKD